MTQNLPTIRENLHTEFSRRRCLNSRYSLRTFAKELGVSTTALSMAMADKRALSRKNLLKVINALGLANAFSENLKLSEVLGKRKIEKKELAEEEFSLISAWYYLAILNLAKVGSCWNDPVWIGKRLGISAEAAGQAIGRLVSLGYLKEHRGLLTRTVRLLDSSRDIPSQSIKNYHRQILQLAVDSLESVPLGSREMGATTFPMSKGKIPLAKELIRKFRDEMGTLLGEGETEEVYCFSLQLFPLSK